MGNKDILKWTKENKNIILQELIKNCNADNMTKLEIARKKVTAADFGRPHMSEEAKYIVRVALEAAAKDQNELLHKAKALTKKPS